jgi:hypothetical protein
MSCLTAHYFAAGGVGAKCKQYSPSNNALPLMEAMMLNKQ